MKTFVFQASLLTPKRGQPGSQYTTSDLAAEEPVRVVAVQVSASSISTLDYEQALPPWNIDQTSLLPPSVQDFVPKDHVSRFIRRAGAREPGSQGDRGQLREWARPAAVRSAHMVALLLHGYASGLYSSRRIARACRERNYFVIIVALYPPYFRTISDFRKRHLKALGASFLQVLKLCEAAAGQTRPRRFGWHEDQSERV